MKSSKTTRALIESAMMVALATVLSIFKIVEMPYGGSVTVASMLPMIILAYRCGIGWGLGSGLAYAVIQQLLGLNNLSYVTGWQSVVAVITLDYVIAFTAVGLGGIFKRVTRTQRGALALGSVLVCVLRYACHVIAGATVWAGLSIPDAAALIYSLGYNATYMLPEAIVLTAVAYYIGGLIDFSKHVPARMVNDRTAAGDTPLLSLSGLCFLLGTVIDVSMIAPCMQDRESGRFTWEGLLGVNWISVGIVTAITVAIGIALIIAAKSRSKSSDTTEE